MPRVYARAVGYGGVTPNPTYQEVCTASTGHTEAVRVVYDPAKTRYEDLPRTFCGLGGTGVNCPIGLAAPGG